MKERLIKAEAFKKYCRRGYKNTERDFRSGTLRAFARQITEDFCKDIDEQPTVEAIPVDWIREQAQEAIEAAGLDGTEDAKEMIGFIRGIEDRILANAAG